MDICKRLLTELGFYNYSQYMESVMTHDNVQAMKLISGLGIIKALIFLHVSFTNSGYDHLYYRIVNLISLFICSAVLIAMHVYAQKDVKNFHILHTIMFFYIIWTSFNGGVIAYTDAINRGGFIVFLTSQMMSFGLIMIPPFVTIVFCGINFIVFQIFISRMMYFPSIKYMETAIFYVVVIAVNYFHYRAAVMKISREEKMIDDNERLDRLSTTDALTDVRNRTGLRLDFNHLFSDSLCVMMFDIDDFKKYNDHYGHDVGDQILKNFAYSLSAAFGRSHVYRYGGDEFLVIFAMTDQTESPTEMLDDAKKIYQEQKLSKEAQPSSSCGYVYGSCDNDETLRKMIKAADVQLYQSKSKGTGLISSAPFKINREDRR